LGTHHDSPSVVSDRAVTLEGVEYILNCIAQSLRCGVFCGSSNVPGAAQLTDRLPNVQFGAGDALPGERTVAFRIAPP
jgi:hypothetical protein